MKKIIALIIITVMLLTISCSGNELSLLPFMNDSVDGSLDCEGKVFTFASSWYSEWYAFPDDELPTSSVEAMMSRFHSIKEKFNAEFEMLEISTDDITMLLITGESIPELIDTNTYIAYELYKLNALVSLNQLDTVDYNDIKWGEPNFIQHGNFNGEQYGFYPWHWEFIPQFTGTIIFNSELISRFGGSHPYELQENGNWDWENFETELKKFNVFENEIQYYGATIDEYYKLAKAAVLSNGGQIINGNPESGYKFGLTTTEATEALEWAKSLYAQNLFIDEGFKTFSIEGISPYWIGESYYGTVFNPNDVSNSFFAPTALNDYGFIQFPTGPKGTIENIGSYVSSSGRLNYISDVSDIEPENIGTIVDYIFEPIDGIEEGWKDLTQNLIFTANNNETCMDNFVYMLENIGYDFSVQMGDAVLSELDEALDVIITGAKSVSEALGTIESVVMAEIDK